VTTYYQTKLKWVPWSLQADNIERRIWELHKAEYERSENPRESTDFVSSFIQGTKKTAVGLHGGNFFCVTYPFIGSVS